MISKKNKEIMFLFYASVFVIFLSVNRCFANDCKIMPKELVEYAASLDLSPVNDFYDSLGISTPPFCYFFLTDVDAVFWASKNGINYLVLFSKLGNEPITTGIQFEALHMPGGLRIAKEKVELSEFFSVENSKRMKKKGRRLLSVIIEDNDGVETKYINVDKKWWFLKLD